ncbi:hypothetical protein [Rickettsia endosymbiont of Polydrusus tereticollis]
MSPISHAISGLATFLQIHNKSFMQSVIIYLHHLVISQITNFIAVILPIT